MHLETMISQTCLRRIVLVVFSPLLWFSSLAFGTFTIRLDIDIAGGIRLPHQLCKNDLHVQTNIEVIQLSKIHSVLTEPNRACYCIVYPREPNNPPDGHILVQKQKIGVGTNSDWLRYPALDGQNGVKFEFQDDSHHPNLTFIEDKVSLMLNENNCAIHGINMALNLKCDTRRYPTRYPTNEESDPRSITTSTPTSPFSTNDKPETARPTRSTPKPTDPDIDITELQDLPFSVAATTTSSATNSDPDKGMPWSYILLTVVAIIVLVVFIVVIVCIIINLKKRNERNLNKPTTTRSHDTGPVYGNVPNKPEDVPMNTMNTQDTEYAEIDHTLLAPKLKTSEEEKQSAPALVYADVVFDSEQQNRETNRTNQDTRNDNEPFGDENDISALYAKPNKRPKN